MKTIIHRYIGMLLLRVFHPNVYSMQWKNKNCMQSTLNGLVINKVQSRPSKVSNMVTLACFVCLTLLTVQTVCVWYGGPLQDFFYSKRQISQILDKSFFLEIRLIFQSLHCLLSRVKNTLYSLCHNDVKKFQKYWSFRLVVGSK